MFKKYSVNDISKYFSIPKQTIRFYEDKGLIHSHRDSQNGYRYYTYEDINQIFDLAIFHPLGSNLQELNTLLNKGDPDDYQSMLLQKKHELQEKINHLQSLNMQIDSIVGKIQQAQKGINKTFKIETCPRLIINNLTDYSPHGVLFNSPYKANKEDCFCCSLSTSKKIISYRWGFITDIPGQDSLVINPQLAISEIVNLEHEGELLSRLNQKVNQYQEETNYKLGNQIIGKLLLRCHFHGIRQRFTKIWIPIIKKRSRRI